MEKLSLLEAIRKQRNILLSQRESSQQAREIKQLYKEQLLKVTAEESLLEEYLQNNVFFYSEQNVSDSLLNPWLYSLFSQKWWKFAETPYEEFINQDILYPVRMISANTMVSYVQDKDLSNEIKLYYSILKEWQNASASGMIKSVESNHNALQSFSPFLNDKKSSWNLSVQRAFCGYDSKYYSTKHKSFVNKIILS